MESTSPNFFQRLGKQIKEITALSDQIDTLSAAENIKKNIVFKGPNAYILAFAIVIASVGLNVNSIPVIIGAMLVSPLMGPIIGIGYGLGVNDTVFLRKAGKNLMVMVIISLIASFLYFLLSPLELENPTELLARTNPTIFDVLIALFGGFAGIMETCKKEKGTVVSGVAIATALMPPLCTAGYGLASGELSYFIGALYLFFINGVFIALATFLTVLYLKFPITTFADPSKQKKVNRMITTFTIILIIPSIFSAIMVIKENNFNQTAKSFINDNKTLDKSYIYDYKIEHRHKPATIEIAIAGEALSDNEIEKIYESADQHGIMRNQLIIKQNAAMIQDRNNPSELFEGIFKRNDMEIMKREQVIAQMEKELKSYKNKELPFKQMAKEISAQYPNIQSITIARGENVNPSTLTGEEEIIVLIKYKGTIPEKDLMRLKEWLSVRLDFENLRIVRE